LIGGRKREPETARLSNPRRCARIIQNCCATARPRMCWLVAKRCPPAARGVAVEASQSAPGAGKSLRLQQRCRDSCWRANHLGSWSGLPPAGTRDGEIGDQRFSALPTMRSSKQGADGLEFCVWPTDAALALAAHEIPPTRPEQRMSRSPDASPVASRFELNGGQNGACRLPYCVDVPGPQVVGSSPAHVAAFQRSARFDFSPSLSSSHAAPAMFAPLLGVPSTTAELSCIWPSDRNRCAGR
jgi:hypothetical protein